MQLLAYSRTGIAQHAYRVLTLRQQWIAKPAVLSGWKAAGRACWMGGQIARALLDLSVDVAMHITLQRPSAIDNLTSHAVDLEQCLGIEGLLQVWGASSRAACFAQ